MKPASAPSALKVQAVLGDDYEVLEFDAGTRTAAEAAAAVGCTVAQIAKSLIFRTRDTNRPVLVVASGANRVDEKRIAAEIGERIVRADADFVRDATGFAIGGVPPVGHKTPPVTLIDDDLFQHQTIWAAAGTPNAVFRADAGAVGRVDRRSQIADRACGRTPRLSRRRWPLTTSGAPPSPPLPASPVALATRSDDRSRRRDRRGSSYRSAAG